MATVTTTAGIFVQQDSFFLVDANEGPMSMWEWDRGMLLTVLDGPLAERALRAQREWTAVQDELQRLLGRRAETLMAERLDFARETLHDRARARKAGYIADR